MRAGDEADFAAFATGSSGRLFRTAFALCGDREVAREAVHAALVSAYAGWHAIRSAADPEAEVRRLVAREVLGVRATGPEPSDRLLADLAEPDSADRLDALPAFEPDLDAVRDGARDRARRRHRVLGSVLATLAVVLVVAVGFGLGTGEPPAPEAGLARLGPFDLRDGVRGFVDPVTGTTYIAGVAVSPAQAPGLAETGLPTPFGVVYVTPRQEVRLIVGSGRQRLLAPAVGRPAGGFRPSLAYDVREEVVVWMTRVGTDPALVSVHAFGTGEVVASSELGHVDARTAIGGADGGLVAVNHEGGVVDWDWVQTPRGRLAGMGVLGAFRESAWGVRVVDMRNGTALIAGADHAELESWSRFGFSGRSQTWILLAAEGEELLTLDGFHRLTGRPRLVPTGGAPPKELVMAEVADIRSYALDSDGSVLVATASSDSVVYHDCSLGGAWLSCRALDLVRSEGEPPQLLGPSIDAVS